jgi:hypothetical protein
MDVQAFLSGNCGVPQGHLLSFVGYYITRILTMQRIYALKQKFFKQG